MTEGLDKLKKDYGVLAKKYKLPSFVELNSDFDIEKVSADSDVLLRGIRKQILEKIVATLQFLELLLNPVNAPRIYLSFVKQMNAEDRKNIDKVYEGLGQISLNSIVLELSYDEKKEAVMISEMNKDWNKVKPDLSKLLQRVSNPGNLIGKKERSYFG